MRAMIVAAAGLGVGVIATAAPGQQGPCDGWHVWSPALPGDGLRSQLNAVLWVGLGAARENAAFTVFGNMRSLDGVAGGGIFQFRDGAWRAWPSPIRSVISSAVIFDLDGPGPMPESLVIGGRFAPPTDPVSSVARWTGEAWEQIAPAQMGHVEQMRVLDEDGPGPMAPSLYTAGPVRGVGRWTGTGWEFRPLTGAAKIATADLDGAGPEPTRLYAMASARLHEWRDGGWTAMAESAPIMDLISVDRDGDGPEAGVLLAGTADGVAVYGADRVPRRIEGSPDGAAAMRVAAYEDDAGLAVYAMVRRDTELYDLYRSVDLRVFEVTALRQLQVEPLALGFFGTAPVSNAEACESLLVRANRSGGLFFEYGPACLGDFDRDGVMSGTDVYLYALAFERGEARADFNGDGFLDFFDYEAFVVAFETGC